MPNQDDGRLGLRVSDQNTELDTTCAGVMTLKELPVIDGPDSAYGTIITWETSLRRTYAPFL